VFYEAVGDEPAGKVVVLASNGYTDISMGGGTKLLRLHQNGCAGSSRSTTSRPTVRVRQRAGAATA